MFRHMCLPLNYGFLERVWQCSCGCFSNNFSCQNTCQWFFLFFKNHFLYQHIKTIQNVQTILNFSKKKNFQIFWKHRLNRVPKRFLSLLKIMIVSSSMPSPVQGILNVIPPPFFFYFFFLPVWWSLLQRI
jgi:hypothetical protein